MVEFADATKLNINAVAKAPPRSSKRRRMPVSRVALIVLLASFLVCVAILYCAWTIAILDSKKPDFVLEVFKFFMSTVLVAAVGLLYNEYREKVRSVEERVADIARKRRERSERKAQETAAKVSREIQEKRERSDRALQKKKEDSDRALQTRSEEAASKIQSDKEQAAIEAERRALRQRRSEEFLTDFISNYNDIKYFRRELRRSILPLTRGRFQIEAKSYVSLMQDVNKRQLRLEQSRRLLESNPDYLSEISRYGAKKIKMAEEYLRGIVSEYERRDLKNSDDSAYIIVPDNSELYCSDPQKLDRS